MILRFIEHKGWIRIAIFPVAPVVKKEFAKAGALNPFEKLLRDDLVRVDIGPVKRRHYSSVNAKGKHD